MKIYDALIEDHNELKDLLAQLVESERGSEERKSLVHAVKEALIPHSRAEEAVFYNSLREIKIDELKELVMGHGFGEHVQAENLLNILIKGKDVELDEDPAKELKEAIEHHIEEEEGDMFSAAKQVLLDVEAENMAEAFFEMKKQIEQNDDDENLMELVMNMIPEMFKENPHHL